MLKINRINVVIKTNAGDYGFDDSFISGVNFIASEKNTSGKSSILSAIFYGLGFEEIIGGRGEKVLTAVYKHTLEDQGKLLSVIESKIFLEIYNGAEIVSLYRSAKMEGRDNKLISVYYGSLDMINSDKIVCEDFYVHMSNSAVNQKGFHNFLESFLTIKLPFVTTTDEKERKLYLQLLFSAIFIEQKRGWSDILSGMPYLGIKDSKKRVIEFLLGLDVLSNEQKRLQIQYEKSIIEKDWTRFHHELLTESSREGCIVCGLTSSPQIIEEKDLVGVQLLAKSPKIQTINLAVQVLEKEYDELNSKKKKVNDNYDQLFGELLMTEDSIKEVSITLKNGKSQLFIEKSIVDKLNKNIEQIDADISNNKDASKLKKLGANAYSLSAKEICPVCRQHINDSLLISDQFHDIMSVEENIIHLEQQKKMMEFSLNSHKNYMNETEENVSSLTGNYYSLLRLAKAIRNDLYSIDDDFSEAIIQKRLALSERIDSLKNLNILFEEKKREFILLSKRWNEIINRKSLLPASRFSTSDETKLDFLKNNFVSNLKKYGYKSVLNLDEIEISKETYFPIIDNFDMKFDSSASDNIRAIWAYTVAILLTSSRFFGNHPNILLFDEPDQHSIVTNDMKRFFEDIVGFNCSCQVFVGITIIDDELKEVLNHLERGKIKIVNIENKGFTKL
jgi:hypothetical protein